MQYNFDWASDVPEESKLLAEAAVTETAESVHSPINFCHAGTVFVTLSATGVFNDEFVGNLKCSCGKAQGIAKGKLDGSSITLETVPG